MCSSSCQVSWEIVCTIDTYVQSPFCSFVSVTIITQYNYMYTRLGITESVLAKYVFLTG